MHGGFLIVKIINVLISVLKHLIASRIGSVYGPYNCSINTILHIPSFVLFSNRIVPVSNIPNHIPVLESVIYNSVLVPDGWRNTTPIFDLSDRINNLIFNTSSVLFFITKPIQISNTTVNGLVWLG